MRILSAGSFLPCHCSRCHLCTLYPPAWWGAASVGAVWPPRGCVQGPGGSGVPHLPGTTAALGRARAKTLPAACVLSLQHQLSRSFSRETCLLGVPRRSVKMSCVEQMAPNDRSNNHPGNGPGAAAEAAGAGLPGEGRAAQRVLSWPGSSWHLPEGDIGGANVPL